MSPWAEKESTCTECGARIEWWPDDGMGPADWFDADRHDLGSPGNTCPESGAHEPAEATA